jgi:hypothetical protein
MRTSGNIPVVLSVPHGGDLSIPDVTPRATGTSEPDFHTVELAVAIQDELAKYEVAQGASAGNSNTSRVECIFFKY